jgi:hypothetical protein
MYMGARVHYIPDLRALGLIMRLLQFSRCLGLREKPRIRCVSQKHLSLLLLLICAVIGWPPTANGANFFAEAWGVVTDPLKLRQSSQTLAESLDRTLLQLQQLEGVVNYDVKERLEQIRSILKDAINGGNEVIANATRAMLEIEGRVNEDALKFIYSAKCAVDVTLKSTAEEALAGLLNQISEARPAISFLGITILDFRTKKLSITNPNVAYQSAKAESLGALSKDVRDSSAAVRIYFAYQSLQAAAKYALCYYTLNNGPAGQRLWVEEVNEMERLLTPWTVVLLPDINFKP